MNRMSRIGRLLWAVSVLAMVSACGGPTGEERAGASPRQTLERVQTQLDAAAKRAQQRLQQADP